jgi:signal transduction histidine kinase
MTQSTLSEKNVLLHDVLHLIAAKPDEQETVSALLEIGLRMTSAVSASFILFDEPQMFITVGHPRDWSASKANLPTLAASLAPGFTLNPSLPDSLKSSSSVAGAPLNHATGLVWLDFDTKPKWSADDQTLLNALLDGLNILAANIQAREKHENSHQLTTSLLRSITDPLLVIDEDRKLLLMNPAAEAVFETQSSAARGKTLAEVVRSEDLVAQAESKGKPSKEWATEDGKTFIPHIESVHDAEGNLEGWILALRDVTRFKKLNRNQSEFTRIVSHDLRSPLTSMQGFAEMLEQQLFGPMNEKQMHFVSKILAGISQMTSIVDNIQDAGRYDPETGFYELSRSQCDLREMVKRITENHLVPAEKELKISVSVDDNVPIINADVNMLERAIINLFDNAIKYTPSGGAIDLKVTCKNDKAIVMVHDNGMGISEDEQKLLFERHRRLARQEHKKIKGTGLGLFIVRSVAQRHGGDAWVESKEGEGSTFFFSIPIDDTTQPVAEN